MTHPHRRRRPAAATCGHGLSDPDRACRDRSAQVQTDRPRRGLR